MNTIGSDQTQGLSGGIRIAVSIALVALLPAIGGCAGSRGGPVNYDRADFVAPDPVNIASIEADHRVSPGDVLTVDVFQVEAVSGEREVDALGRIQMPLIGVVPVIGKTSDEIGRDLTERLDKTYLKQPKVQVSIKSVKQQTVTVDGSVKAPGVFPIPGSVTLLQAIAMAHGTDESANAKRVVVFRKINGQRQAAAFDLSTIRTAQDPDPQIYADDVIVVDGSKTRQAFRDIMQSFPLLSIFRPF